MSEEQVPPPPPPSSPPPPPSSPPPPPSSPPPSSPPPSGGSSSGPVSENRQVMIVLSYIWILALVPFLTEKDDPEVKWHSRHGLVLTGVELVAWIAMSILAMVPAVGCLIVFVMPVFGLAALIFRVICIVKGTKGERLVVPYVSEYADQF